MSDILDYCADLKQTLVPSGQFLIREGERQGKLFVLIDGQVEIIRERTQVTLVDEPGSVFGEMAVLLEMPHSATVRALSDTRVFELPNALEFLASRPELALHLATMLARRLYYTTSYLIDLQQQAAGKRQDLDLVDRILANLVSDETASPADNSRQ